MAVNSYWALEKILEGDRKELLNLFETFDEYTFEQWYIGCLGFYQACQDHINERGLEHLRDRYER